MRPVLLLLLLAPLVQAAPKTHVVKLNGHTFTLPEGFTIELAAKTPLVDRPIVASFDDKGRLYVADSSGSNEKPDVQLKNPTHRIMRLEDTKGTGVFDKATVFADKMMFPEGILWHKGSVFVGAPPHIWKLTDTDDDGKADKRDIWFDGKTLTGCANDMHGPYLGPDGYLYWCKGAFAKQTYTLPNGKPFTTRASHIFRAKPDGTGVEPVMTGGMDNPVDVAFLPNGERFFTTTFLQHPAGGKRDGIIHAVYGGIYGKDHDVIYDPDHKWTSPNVMPVMTHLGPAAPCGLHCYASDALGEGFRGNLFACQFNLRKVSRHILKPSGSTYTTEDSDFVVSDNQDFHPTDVIEDADGSLLIVDTGGWYKLCCPSSQLVKTDVFGAIYRVRPKVKVIDKERIESESDEGIQELIHESSLTPGLLYGHRLWRFLYSKNLITRRKAAEALGRIGGKAAVPALLDALESKDIDRTLEHALTYALIEIGDREPLKKAVGHENAKVRRACLVALDQLGEKLDFKTVFTAVESKDEALRETALWIIGRHTEYADDVAKMVRDRAPLDSLPMVAKFARTPVVEKALLEVLSAKWEPANHYDKVHALIVLTKASPKDVPPAWIDAIAKAIQAGDVWDVQPAALVTLRSLPVIKGEHKELSKALSNIYDREPLLPRAKLTAMSVQPGGMKDMTRTQFQLVLQSLDRDKPSDERGLASEVVSRAKLTPEQLTALSAQLPKVSPLELDRVMSAFAQTKDDETGKQLVAAMNTPAVRPSLRVDGVKERIKHFGPVVQAEAEKLYVVLNADFKQQIATLEAVAKRLPAGDIRRGQAVFNSAKTSCIACHTIGYVGGKTGPDLTRIGGIRTERDLLEAVLFPSASFVRSYEPVSVKTTDGRVINGAVKKDAPDELIVTVAADKDVRLDRKEIEEITPGKVSVMPAGLAQQITEQELADLIAFLKGCK